MKSGVDRAERDAQDLGDLLEGEIGVIAQDQHASVVDRQASDRRFELVTVDDVIDPAGYRRLVSRQDPKVR